MKKPHEQEWTKDEHQMGRIRCTDTVTLDIRVATFRHPGGDSAALSEAAAVVDLALAAPDMARALMAFVENAKESDLRFVAAGPLSLAYDALRKAGVIP
jgi:hypothetical protein